MFFFDFLLGIIVGVITGVLIAPESGDKTRKSFDGKD